MRPSSPFGANGSYPTLTTDYQIFDRALRNAYFTTARAGEPVYLDMDDDVLSSAARAAGLDVDEFQTCVIDVVRANLVLTARGTPAFSNFDSSLQRWKERFRETRHTTDVAPPPVVALLSVLTLAAEQMGDSRMHDNAYYARLCTLLRIADADQHRFVSAFRRSTESYWSALETWLESLDGDRGIATAYSLAHRYVGLPVSQALVREAERHDLRRMFEQSGLPSIGTISAMEMELALDAWITDPASRARANLTHLWQSDARNRLVDIAVREHEIWDGIPRYGHEPRTVQKQTNESRVLRLALSPRTDLFSTVYDTAVLIPTQADECEVLTEDGSICVPTMHAGPGLRAIRFEDCSIDVSSALSGILRIMVANSPVLARYPRDVITMTWSESLNLFIESDRAAIGERSVLIVHDIGGLPVDVDNALDAAARPGHTRLSAHTPGIPDGWALYTDVQLVRAPRVRRELSALEPRLRVHMTLSGGFRLPGRIQKWGLHDLPEVVVTSDEDSDVQIDLEERVVAGSGSASPVATLASRPAPIIIKLAKYIHHVGDFNIILRSGKRRLQVAALRVRSGDDPDGLSWSKATGLTHATTDGLWTLRAEPVADPSGISVDGAFSHGRRESLAKYRRTSDGVQGVWQAEPSTTAKLRPVRLPLPEQTSCVQTGAHHFQLPTSDPRDKGRASIIIGICQTCGLSNRYPIYYKHAMKRQNNDRRIVDVSKLPSPAASRGWLPALEAINYIGAGSRRDLAMIARQLENSSQFEQHFIRSLESAATIELSRDGTWLPTAFEVASTGVAETADGAGLLVGNWSPSETTAAVQLVRELGGSVRTLNRESINNTLIRVNLDRFGRQFDDLPVAHDAGLNLLLALPHISQVLPNLPRATHTLIPGSFDVFSPATGRWTAIDHEPGSGAFRLHNRRTPTYVLKIDSSELRLVRHDLAKHAAALLAGKQIMRYDAARSILTMPVGAPLPGLYERAAVLQSGQLPSIDRPSFSLRYSGITQTFADELIARFS